MNIQSNQYHARIKRNRLLISTCGGLLVVLAFVTLLVGRYPKAGFTPPARIFNDPLMRNIIVNVRLARVVLAILAGAILAGAGFVFQMLFSNPLVEPGFLGVSQGAAFGAALVIIVAGYSTVLVQISATVFGLLALALSYILARHFRFGGWMLRLVLAGIAVSAIFSSGLAMLKLVADPTRDLQDITFWMMGGLWNSTWTNTLSVLPVAAVSLAILVAYRWRLNVLSLNDRTAHSVGLSPNRDKLLLLFVATVGTTVVISVTGLVGWIGLIIPHLARRLFGSDSRHALPGAILMGAIFLLLCDTIGRTMLAGEIPLGLLTSIIGATIFIIILTRRRHGANL
jgi:iron complex transport system permease protein